MMTFCMTVVFESRPVNEANEQALNILCEYFEILCEINIFLSGVARYLVTKYTELVAAGKN